MHACSMPVPRRLMANEKTAPDSERMSEFENLPALCSSQFVAAGALAIDFVPRWPSVTFPMGRACLPR
jgi:hypothetical protein